MNDIFSIIACVGVVIYFVSKHFKMVPYINYTLHSRHNYIVAR